MNITAKPCPHAKKAPGRLRFVGEKEYKCSMSCEICRGRGMTFGCPECEGCGLLRGVICQKCRGCGLVPVAA